MPELPSGQSARWRYVVSRARAVATQRALRARRGRGRACRARPHGGERGGARAGVRAQGGVPRAPRPRGRPHRRAQRRGDAGGHARARGGRPSPAIYTGGHTGPEAALPTLLEIAVARDAPACALLEALPRPRDAGWLRALLEPVLAGGYDLVVPSYARGRLEGVLVTGIVYPLTRALFGKRLRQPLGRELVLSSRLAQHILSETEWRTDPSLAGSGPVVRHEGARARGADRAGLHRPAAPPRGAAAGRLRRARGRARHPVPRDADRTRTTGSGCAAPRRSRRSARSTSRRSPPPRPRPRRSSTRSRSGWRDLRPIWSRVLPPQTLLALQRIPSTPPEAFRMPDAIWARVLYDFAVGWRFKALDRRAAPPLAHAPSTWAGWRAT